MFSCCFFRCLPSDFSGPRDSGGVVVMCWHRLGCFASILGELQTHLALVAMDHHQCFIGKMYQNIAKSSIQIYPDISRYIQIYSISSFMNGPYPIAMSNYPRGSPISSLGGLDARNRGVCMSPWIWLPGGTLKALGSSMILGGNIRIFPWISLFHSIPP